MGKHGRVSPIIFSMSVRTLVLKNVPEDKIDSVLALSEQEQDIFFSNLIKKYYPSVDVNTDAFSVLMASYISSWVTEKLYRNNSFMNACFSVIYTKTGLIRNICNDIYYTSDDLIIH